MSDELLVNTLIIMAGIESKQPDAMPLEDNPLFVAAERIKQLTEQSERHIDALTHIAKTCSQSRSRTRRLCWISARANSAVNGNENWQSVDIPKGISETSQQSLRFKIKQLQEQVDAGSNAVLAGRIADLTRVNSGLVAQVEQFRLWADRLSFELAHDDNYEPGHTFCKLQDTLAATPAQCLADVWAQAGRDGYIAGALAADADLEMPDFWLSESADEYANQLRQQAKDNESAKK